MSPPLLLPAALAACLLAASALPAAERPAQVLILSGANNHDWKKTTPVLAKLLAGDSGRFSVAIREDVPLMTPADLAGIDLVVSNFNTFGRKGQDQVWQGAMRQAFLAHIQAGRGCVCVHAGSSLWYDWPDFFALAGGRWGKGTHHGAQQAATVQVVDRQHPITAQLPASFATRDEIWQGTEMADGIHLLASVTLPGAAGSGGAAEPIAWTTTSGQGRGFTLLLGHDLQAMEQPAFAALFVRGCQWAATGAVSAGAPTLP